MADDGMRSGMQRQLGRVLDVLGRGGRRAVAVDELERSLQDGLSAIHRGEANGDAMAAVYRAYRDRAPASRRAELYGRIRGLVESGEAGWQALALFAREDDDPAVVSTAALDLAVLYPAADGELAGPREVVRMFEQSPVACPAGLFLGLMLLGDRRVLRLLKPLRTTLTEDEVGQVARGWSGLLFAGTVEFVLDWLEEAEAAGDDGRYGHLASALVIMRQQNRAPFVIDGWRRFPVDPEDPFDGEPETIPIDEFSQRITPQLLALADRERAPRVMPVVLDVWGISST